MTNLADTPEALAIENGYPQLRSQRTWGTWAIFGTSVSTAIATWCFIIGGFAGYYLGAVQGTLAILAGSLIGILFIVLACLPMCNKYGIDSVVASRAQLGMRGSLLSVLMVYGSTVGWNVMLFVLIGRASDAVAGAMGWDAPSWFVNVIGVASIVLVFALLKGGPGAVRDVSQPIAISVLVLGFIIMGVLAKEEGLQNLLDAPPVAAWDDAKVNWASAIEVLIASNLSWWAYTGAMVRNSPSARRSLWPVVIGLGLGVGVGSLTGLYASLTIPDSGGDPTQFLVEVAGTVFGVIALLFIILANVGTAIVGVYASTLAIRQLPGLAKGSWRTSVLISVLPAVLLVGLWANLVFDKFPTFLAFLGVCFGPICGIQIVDYFLLRKQRLSGPGLYDYNGPYRFWAGINPVGLLAFAAGVVTYVYLLDPVDYTSRAPFQYMTASVPAIVVSGAVFYVGTRLINQPLGRGGYAVAEADSNVGESLP